MFNRKCVAVGILAIVGIASCSAMAASGCAFSASNGEAALKAAYERALASIDASEHSALEKSQREWQENHLETSPKCPVSKRIDPEKLDSRRAWLEGRAETGLNEPVVQPFLLWRDAKPGDWKLMLDLARIEKPSAPGDYLFNSAIARIRKDAENKARPSSPDENDSSRDSPYEYSASVRLTYASPRLLSARFNLDEEGGGPHGSYPTYGVTIDRQRGIKLEFDDLLKPDALPVLRKNCLNQVAKETGGKLDTEYKDALDKGVMDLGHWHFTASDAEVVFGDYEVAGFSAGHPSCHFPLATLKKLTWPDALLPE